MKKIINVIVYYTIGLLLLAALYYPINAFVLNLAFVVFYVYLVFAIIVLLSCITIHTLVGNADDPKVKEIAKTFANLNGYGIFIRGVIPSGILAYSAFMHGLVISSNIFIVAMFISYMIIYGMIAEKEKYQ